MKLIVSVFILSLLFIFISCEEDFNPKGNFRDETVLNCIISGANGERGYGFGIQGFISKTYNPIDVLAPDTANHSLLRGATINISQYYSNYELRDCYLRWDPKFQDYLEKPANYYTLYKSSEIRFLPNRYVKLSARMPDGKILTSESTLPDLIWPELNFDFSQGITPKINQFLWGNGVTFKWNLIYPDHLVSSYLEIECFNSRTKKYLNVKVPMKYVRQNDKMVPVYPSIGKYSSVHFEFAALDSALKSISGKDTEKKDYDIGRCKFHLIELDSELSTYYSSVHGSLDTYSVRLDENVYSNIRGGFGIFGSFMHNSMPKNLNKDYIESFGYTFIQY